MDDSLNIISFSPFIDSRNTQLGQWIKGFFTFSTPSKPSYKSNELCCRCKKTRLLGTDPNKCVIIAISTIFSVKTRMQNDHTHCPWVISLLGYLSVWFFNHMVQLSFDFDCMWRLCRPTKHVQLCISCVFPLGDLF